MDLARYLEAGADDLSRTVGTWLGRDKVVALAVVPEGRHDLALTGSESIAGVSR